MRILLEGKRTGRDDKNRKRRIIGWRQNGREKTGTRYKMEKLLKEGMRRIEIRDVRLVERQSKGKKAIVFREGERKRRREG